jgi:hypothetical protein
MSELGDDLDARVSSQCLDSGDVREVQASFFGKALLGQSALLAQSSDVRGEGFQGLHALSLMADQPSVYG